MRSGEVRGVLERHRLDPDADVAAVIAEIEARVWTVRVEKAYTPERGPRYRALASRPAPDTHPSLEIRLNLSASGPARQAALMRALAKILAREERLAPSLTIPPRER